MQGKTAAGFIVTRKIGKLVEFLLLQTSYGINHWTPPKGHVDPGEELFQTAIRETQEEAGLLPEHYTVFEDFKETLKYPVNGKEKTVYYWLAELKDPNTPIILSDEHINYQWNGFEKTKRLSNFKEMDHAFDNAYQYLLEHQTKSK